MSKFNTRRNVKKTSPGKNAPAFHPVAGIFPEMTGAELADLARDIRARGLREPIWTYKGAIVDGRNRFKACGLARVRPRFRAWRGREKDLVGFVVSFNLHRRHLSESQRAMVAARLATLERGRPKKGGKPGGKIGKFADLSQGAAAGLLKVSARTVGAAAKVIAEGAPDLSRAVETGKCSAHLAAALAGLPKAEQAAALALGERGLKEVAKKARASRQAERRAERIARNEKIAVRGSPGGKLSGLGRTFAVIYADPPTKTRVYSEATGHEKSPENHYPTMTLEELKAMPVGKIAAKNCALFLWTREVGAGVDLARTWGFEPVSFAGWDKVDAGTGYWFRDDLELLIVATKGDVPAPIMGTQPRRLHREKKSRRHSAKPAYYRALIDRYFPGTKKIELFARGDAPKGWTFWGFEAGVKRAA